MIQNEVRMVLYERRSSRAASMAQLGARTRWEQDQRFTLSDLWYPEPYHITFLIHVMYVLPSPLNPFTWGKVETLN